MTTGLIILGILVVLILWIITIYNRLVSQRNQVKNSWSQIDVQLQRRYDLIPNLVETVKGEMNFERSTLEAVINARSRAMSARETIAQNGGPTESSLKPLLSAETALSGSLSHIFALSENYPQLRASENMQHLQEELSSTENKVAYARQSYNDQVLTYNNAQQVFPAVLVANLFGHHVADLYAIEEPEAKKAVKVSF